MEWDDRVYSLLIKVEGTEVKPSVTGVAIQSTPSGFYHPSGKIYGPGETVLIAVSFDNAVEVDSEDGLPRIELDIGDRSDGNEWAEYATGSGTTTLYFSYTVEEGDYDRDGIGVWEDSLELNGGTIGLSGASAISADLEHDGIDDDADHRVGDIPRVLSVEFRNAPYVYGAGGSPEIVATFSTSVWVPGGNTPSNWNNRAGISLEVGGETRRVGARGRGGPGNTEVTFDRYTFGNTDFDADGISIPANAIEGAELRTGSGQGTPIFVELPAYTPATAIEVNGGQPHDGDAPAREYIDRNANLVTISYDEVLSTSSTPPASAFTVRSGGSTVPLAATDPVRILGSTVLLTLAQTPSAYVTVSYTVPEEGAVEDPTGNDAAGFSDVAERQTVSITSATAGDDIVVGLDHVIVTLVREGDTSQGLDVTIGLSATGDFLEGGGTTVTRRIGPGKTSETVIVAATYQMNIPDSATVVTGVLTATLMEGSQYRTGTSPSVEIALSGVANPTRIWLEKQTMKVVEGQRTATVNIVVAHKTGLPEVDTEVTLALTTTARRDELTATSSVDFDVAQGMPRIDPDDGETVGEEIRQTLTLEVPITEDSTVEGDETFEMEMELSGARPEGVRLEKNDGSDCDDEGTPQREECVTLITILDDDLEPVTGLTARSMHEAIGLAWDTPAANAPISRHEYRYATSGPMPDTWNAIADSAPGETNEDAYTVTRGSRTAMTHVVEIRAVEERTDPDAGDYEARSIGIRASTVPQMRNVGIADASGEEGERDPVHGGAVRDEHERRDRDLDRVHRNAGQRHPGRSDRRGRGTTGTATIPAGQRTGT